MICKKTALDIRSWFTEVSKEAKLPDAELLAILLWQIWFVRNELCFEKYIYRSRSMFQKGTRRPHGVSKMELQYKSEEGK